MYDFPGRSKQDFSDVPSRRALAGGARVMGAVVADIISGNRARKH